jgi:hypothetical protein
MSIEKQIISQIEKSGFQLLAGDPSPFSAALKKNIFFADNFFLVIDFKEGYAIEDIIATGRSWVSSHVGFFKGLLGSALNLVIFHQGELSAENIQGQCDWTSRPSANLLTITIINVQNKKIEQERTWILLPTIKSTLKNISIIQY